jgi:DNA-binding PadR family transcriptional regulator
MARSFQRSPFALAVLALLYEAPTHPYRMQQLIKERGKDKVINVQRRASLYQTIGQLQKAGLIAVRETSREEKRPERTTYALTRKGYETAQSWMREALSTPALEFPEFPAAISFLPLLTPEDALSQLEKREVALADGLDDIDAGLRTTTPFLPRLFLLEDELMRATLEAELKWVRGVIDDLRSGQLTWNDEWVRGFTRPESDAKPEE